MTLSIVSFPICARFTLIWFLTAVVVSVSCNPGVFNVKYRYPRLQGSLSALKEHDDRRQLTILAGIDLPLGELVALISPGFIMQRLELEHLQRAIMFKSTLAAILCGSTASSVNNVQDEALSVSS